MHAPLDLRGNIPAFTDILTEQSNDANVLNALWPEAGALYIMDRAHSDFRRPHSNPADRRAGVICYRVVGPAGSRASIGHPDHMQRVRYRDKTRPFRQATLLCRPRPLRNCTGRDGAPSCSSSG